MQPAIDPQRLTRRGLLVTGVTVAAGSALASPATADEPDEGVWSAATAASAGTDDGVEVVLLEGQERVRVQLARGGTVMAGGRLSEFREGDELLAAGSPHSGTIAARRVVRAVYGVEPRGPRRAA